MNNYNNGIMLSTNATYTIELLGIGNPKLGCSHYNHTEEGSLPKNVFYRLDPVNRGALDVITAMICCQSCMMNHVDHDLNTVVAMNPYKNGKDYWPALQLPQPEPAPHHTEIQLTMTMIKGKDDQGEDITYLCEECAGPSKWIVECLEPNNAPSDTFPATAYCPRHIKELFLG